MAEEKNEIGIATGLAWTEVGGEILVTEATLMPGRGRLMLTGKLGDVMQESAQAAMSWVRSRAEELGIPRDFNRRTDVHVHRGKVLPIGGVKEKLLAAHRAGLTNILLPKDNENDLADIPKNVLDVMNVHLVESMDEVLRLALAGPLPTLPPPSADDAIQDLETRHESRSP